MMKTDLAGRFMAVACLIALLWMAATTYLAVRDVRTTIEDSAMGSITFATTTTNEVLVQTTQQVNESLESLVDRHKAAVRAAEGM